MGVWREMGKRWIQCRIIDCTLDSDGGVTRQLRVLSRKIGIPHIVDDIIWYECNHPYQLRKYEYRTTNPMVNRRNHYEVRNKSTYAEAEYNLGGKMERSRQKTRLALFVDLLLYMKLPLAQICTAAVATRCKSKTDKEAARGPETC